MSLYLNKRSIHVRLAAIFTLMAGASGCATSLAGSGAGMPAWTNSKDCFNRDVLETVQYAEQMAIGCAGPDAAADPNRSGVERATAYFNAAAGYNLLGASGTTSLACETSSACYQFALNLIEKSLINQEDALVRKDNVSPLRKVDERFILRRRLAQARALAGTAVSGSPACAEPDQCLGAASGALATQDLAALAARPDDPIAVFACQGLDLSAQISQLRGTEHEYAAITDLRQIIRSCPSLAAGATNTLAKIAYNRGEQLRGSMAASAAANAPPSQSAALGVSAVSSYRDALGSASVSLPAYRGLGTVYLALAGLEPGKAGEHFDAARDAFDAAQKISAATPDDAHAKDLEQLGVSYMNLAGTKRPVDQLEQERLIDAAIRVLVKSTSLSPTYDRQMILGEAYEQAGRSEEAEAVYRTALATGQSAGHETATLSLARLLERTGKAEEALSVLQKASASGLRAASVRYEIGRLQFGRSDFVGVIEALSPVAGTLPAAQTAEARYMLSVAETVLRRTGWQARARAYADDAAQANSFSAKYARQACLSHILASGPDVKSGASLQRCPAGDTAEKHLLRGMYFLKQAQLIDVSAYDIASQDYWRSVLRLAQDAFQSGEAALKARPEANTNPRFDDLGRVIDLAAVLSQGKLVVERCRRDASVEFGSQTWKDLEAFYGHYGVLKCSAS
jgi:tetratricopeptide (TPR) repeat protein